MEESRFEKLINDTHTRAFVIDSRIDRIQEKLEELEEKLQKIFWFIEFHLGEVPQKYRKAYPIKGEYPYFKTKSTFSKAHKIDVSTERTPAFDEFEIPKDPKELSRAKEYMSDLAKKGWPERLKMSEANEALSDENWNRFMPASSEAFPTFSVSPDFVQEDKQSESSPSSQESPDQ